MVPHVRAKFSQLRLAHSVDDVERPFCQSRRGPGVARDQVVGITGDGLVGVDATEGVFVTTSPFSQPAIDFARHLSQRVVLIDGARLADLMIEHDVGIRSARAVEFKCRAGAKCGTTPTASAIIGSIPLRRRISGGSMPDLTVAEQILYSTVKLTALKGGAPTSTGTGFFMDLALQGDQMVPVIVTNKHVVSNSDRIVAVCHFANEEGSKPSGDLLP